MLRTVLGACGAWLDAGQACSGYLVEHDGFRLLLDVGYATVPRLLQRASADSIDAVFVSHGHPDHCADLSPLLRAGAARRPTTAAADLRSARRVGRRACVGPPRNAGQCLLLHEFTAGDELSIGPFRAETRLLPHTLPNAAVRLSAVGRVLAYTGDTGPSPEVVALAREADLLLAEATYVDQVPEDSRRHLSSASQAGLQATEAGAGPSRVRSCCRIG